MSVVVLPFRQQSPACAFHVGQVVRRLRPQTVLVEGPRDATALIPLLLDGKTVPPVTLHGTVRRASQAHTADLVLTAFSPELVALQAGAEVGAALRFVDLTLAETLALPPDVGSVNIAGIEAACRLAGARDADDLWDGLFEADFRMRDSDRFFEDVAGWAALCSTSAPETARLQAMRAELASATGTVVVVVGAARASSLPVGEARAPARSDGEMTLLPYDFARLGRQGYSPELSQRRWENRPVTDLLVEIAHALRPGPSTADAIAAGTHASMLASLRGHRQPTREDLLDGVRSLYMKGDDPSVLAVARRCLAGSRVGSVPGAPSLLADFERVAARLGIDVSRDHAAESTLDLYRSATHRARSRFFHQLGLLGIDCAERTGGPDFATGEDLGRGTEVWRWCRSDETDAGLARQSPLGATVEEAAADVLWTRIDEAERHGRRSLDGARLLSEACRAGLHRHMTTLPAVIARWLAADPSFVSVVGAGDELELLAVSREPLEAGPLVDGLPAQAWARGASLVPWLGATAEADEPVVLDAMCAWSTHAVDAVDAAVRTASLRALASGGNPAVLGGADGLLYDDGVLEGAALGQRLAGYLGGTSPSLGARYLTGLLRSARSVAWRETAVTTALDNALGRLDRLQFLRALPHLRLAFADLTPTETDRVARVAAGVPTVMAVSTESGKRADELVRAALIADGLDGE